MNLLRIGPDRLFLVEAVVISAFVADYIGLCYCAMELGAT